MPDYQQEETQALNKGVNLRDDPETLSDGQWRRLTNVRSFSEGSISTRPGRRWVAGASNGNEVHTITKLGKQIISASGTRAYRNDSPYPTIFNGLPLSVVRHKASDGDERWLYVTEGSNARMLGEDESDIKWGITAPTRIVIATATSTAGLLDSSAPGGIVYNWRAVYKNSRTGGKSNPSPVHTGIAAALVKVKLTADSSLDGQVDTVEFYRQGGLNGADTWRFVGSTPNKGLDPVTNSPIPVEFTDNMSDAEAVKGFEIRVDNDVPFTTTGQGGNAIYEAVFQYIWGPLNGAYLFAAGDPNRPGDVYWTNPGRPHSASPFNHITVSPPDEPIVGGFIHGGTSYVWTRENLYPLEFRGTDALPTFTARRSHCGRGLSLPGAFAVGPWIWFFSKDGIYLTDGESPAEPYTEADLRPLFTPQVEDRTYVAPGNLASVAWPPYTISVHEVGEGFGEGPNVDFAVSAPLTPISVAGGGTATVLVTVAGDDRFFDDVGLSIVSSTLPPGLSYAFSPSSGVPAGSHFTSTLTFTATSTVSAGVVVFQVRGRRVGGSLTHDTAQITLTVTAGTATPPTPPTPPSGSFNLTLAPSAVTIPRTGSANVDLGVQPLNGFAGVVTFTAPSLPTGVTVNFGPAQLTPPGTPARVRIMVSDLAALGAASVDLIGTSGSVTDTATILLNITGAPPDPPDIESMKPVLRLNYGGKELHLHYRDKIGQWVHLRNDLPYSRWSNDESPEIPGYGDTYETISFFDEEQANTALLIGTNRGLVALETGTYDYIPGHKIQARIRHRSVTYGAPRTLKEFGNIVVEADCGDAVLPAAIDAAQPAGLAIIPYLNAEKQQLGYQRISGTGRTLYPLVLADSFNGQPVFGKSLALDILWNGNATVYGWLTQFHPDEEYITGWAFGPTTHGVRGWKQISDIYITLTNPFGDVTPTVEIDGVEYALKTNSGASVIPATSLLSVAANAPYVQKQKVHLWAPPVKGLVYRWKLAGPQFKLYGNECEINIKEIAAGQGYNLVSAFSGGSAEV